MFLGVNRAIFAQCEGSIPGGLGSDVFAGHGCSLSPMLANADVQRVGGLANIDVSLLAAAVVVGHLLLLAGRVKVEDVHHEFVHPGGLDVVYRVSQSD